MLRVIVSIVLVFGLNAALAQNVFTVSEVPVAAEADSAAAAQQIAREEGRKQALDILLRRLVAEQDWIYLPSLAEGLKAQADQSVEQDFDGAYVPEPTMPLLESEDPRRAVVLGDAQVRALELETNVFNEKSSGTTYRAEITYRFKPDGIRSLLRGARIPYSEEQARQTLIIPVLVTEAGTYLWESKNPWARAWLERPLGNELTPMVLPVGDVLDIQALTADEARQLNAAALRAFLERYENMATYLAVGRLSERNQEFRLFVQLVEATPPSLDRDAPITSSFGRRVLELNFSGANDDFPALARAAVRGSIDQHAAAWKQRTRVDYGLQRTLELTAWYREQRELSHIQDAISSSALVIDLDPGVFNNEAQRMTLTVVGEEDQFGLAMRERDLDVWEDERGRWHIAELDFAAELKARDEPLSADLVDEQTERGQETCGLGRFFGRGGDCGDSREEDAGSNDEEIPELPDDLFGDDNGR